MKPQASERFTAFLGPELVTSGALSTVAVTLHDALQRQQDAVPLVFDDDTGNPVELHLRGSPADVAARRFDKPLPERPASGEKRPGSPGRGARLGVIAREVTLLPEHWDRLASPPGGASVVLRKLVHEARRANAARDRQRHAEERIYNAMVALAGNLPAFEEASRALFAGGPDRMASVINAWPAEIRNYLARLSAPSFMSGPSRR